MAKKGKPRKRAQRLSGPDYLVVTDWLRKTENWTSVLQTKPTYEELAARIAQEEQIDLGYRSLEGAIKDLKLTWHTPRRDREPGNAGKSYSTDRVRYVGSCVADLYDAIEARDELLAEMRWAIIELYEELMGERDPALRQAPDSASSPARLKQLVRGNWTRSEADAAADEAKTQTVLALTDEV